MTGEVRLGGPLLELRRSLGRVAHNRDLSRIQLAFLGSSVGDWAYATAMAVWAYGEGGAKVVGIWLAVRYALMALTAPFAAGLVDRMSRKRLMILADLTRALLIGAAALCLFVETSVVPVFVLATLAAVPSTPFMVAQRSLLPTLARRPDELSAANGIASTITALAFFAGPALAAVLLGITSVQVVLVANVATFLWSMAFLAGVSASVRPEAVAAPVSTYLAETSAGLRTIVRDRRLVLIAVATCAQTVVSGASTVFVLVMADSLLETGPRGFGYLQTALGLGALAGGLVAISRSSRGRLGSDLIVGVALWSLPLVMVTAWPTPLSCLAAMAMLGLGNAFVDVNLDTIVQRVVPDDLLGRVFGTLEAGFIVTMALGALAMPFLIDGLGLRPALLALAVPVALIAGLLLPSMRRLDSTLRAPANLPLVAAVDIFAPLPPGAVETLARAARSMRFDAGATLVREGEEAGLFFIIESGQVEVTQGQRVLRHQGSGGYFGEIGLLRDVPRTATITALEDTVVQVIDRDDFLRAVTGHRGARLAADSVATRRLAV